MTEAVKHAPNRIRVAQDVDGFWTCREAVSGSQEYIRADIADGILVALIMALPYVETAEFDEGYKQGVVSKVSKTMRAAIAKAEGWP